MIALPEAEFSGWYPWTVVQSAAGMVPALDEVGTYLLARFEASVPELDPTDKAIFYIGETHGLSRSLRLRLRDFACSAGFGGVQERGHYAAWAYPETFPMDRVGQRTDSSKVYVALCAFPPAPWPRVARGVFPGVVEQMSLWRYTVRNGCLPALNNSGSGHEVPELPPIDASMLQPLFSNEPMDAGEQVLHAIAVALGYSPTRRVEAWLEDEDANGLERALGRGWRLQIAWMGTDAADRVGLRVWNRDKLWFGGRDNEQAAGTEEELRELIGRLWHRWHTEA